MLTSQTIGFTGIYISIYVNKILKQKYMKIIHNDMYKLINKFYIFYHNN